jgi:hypothetical protein
MTDTLTKMKLKRNLTLIGVFLFLAALIGYSAFRPDPEDQKVAEMKSMILAAKPGGRSADERKEIRDMINKLSPETRKKLIREVMRARLEEMRAETANLTEEQKQKKVQEVVIKMRERFSKMSPEQWKKAQERMQSPEGKKMMNEALGFFYKEFTPQERELMSPIVEEISIQMGR